jgi:hypothetical protein
LFILKWNFKFLLVYLLFLCGDYSFNVENLNMHDGVEIWSVSDTDQKSEDTIDKESLSF